MAKMKKYPIINVGNKKEAINLLSCLKESGADIEYKIINLKLTKLNKYCSTTIFHQEQAYVNHVTLIESMKPVGGKGKHNYHGLTPNEIVDALGSLQKQNKVFESNKNPNDIIIVSSIQAECGDNIIVVFELNATLKNTDIHTINKIKSIYPKKKIQNFINSLKQK